MHRVYLEVGSKRVFASALAWPGWSRSGRDEVAALRALAEYGGRYRRALGRWKAYEPYRATLVAPGRKLSKEKNSLRPH